MGMDTVRDWVGSKLESAQERTKRLNLLTDIPQARSVLAFLNQRAEDTDRVDGTELKAAFERLLLQTGPLESAVLQTVFESFDPQGGVGPDLVLAGAALARVDEQASQARLSRRGFLRGATMVGAAAMGLAMSGRAHASDPQPPRIGDILLGGIRQKTRPVEQDEPTTDDAETRLYLPSILRYEYEAPTLQEQIIETLKDELGTEVDSVDLSGLDMSQLDNFNSPQEIVELVRSFAVRLNLLRQMAEDEGFDGSDNGDQCQPFWDKISQLRFETGDGTQSTFNFGDDGTPAITITLGSSADRLGVGNELASLVFFSRENRQLPPEYEAFSNALSALTLDSIFEMNDWIELLTQGTVQAHNLEAQTPSARAASRRIVSFLKELPDLGAVYHWVYEGFGLHVNQDLGKNLSSLDILPYLVNVLGRVHAIKQAELAGSYNTGGLDATSDVIDRYTETEHFPPTEHGDPGNPYELVFPVPGENYQQLATGLQDAIPNCIILSPVLNDAGDGTIETIEVRAPSVIKVSCLYEFNDKLYLLDVRDQVETSNQAQGVLMDFPETLSLSIEGETVNVDIADVELWISVPQPEFINPDGTAGGKTVWGNHRISMRKWREVQEAKANSLATERLSKLKETLAAYVTLLSPHENLPPQIQLELNQTREILNWINQTESSITEQQAADALERLSGSTPTTKGKLPNVSRSTESSGEQQPTAENTIAFDHEEDVLDWLEQRAAETEIPPEAYQITRLTS